jgi:hypothetical protein
VSAWRYDRALQGNKKNSVMAIVHTIAVKAEKMSPQADNRARNVNEKSYYLSTRK